MCLLGGCALALVLRRLSRHEVGAVFLHNKVPGIFLRRLRYLRRVRSHVRDQAGQTPVAHILPFVEPLGKRHRPLRREAELARGILLQRRSGEWWCGSSASFAPADLGHLIGRLAQALSKVAGAGSHPPGQSRPRRP